MADFFPGSKPIINSSFPFFLDQIDSNMQFAEINHQLQSVLFDNSNISNNNFHTLLPDHLFNHQIHPTPDNFPPIFHQNNQNIIPAVSNSTPHSVPEIQSKKRKATDLSETSSMNSSPQVSDCRKGKNISRSRKRAKGTEEEEEKPREVVHVRARRGQATDSHSLAERVRRGKINERLKCLQDIVPGCYKTMGMAVMLDEIINYVQSLQNQVEFLSMKLTAASTYYDFNSEIDAIETMQRAKVQEAKEMERGGGSMNTYYHPSCSL